MWDTNVCDKVAALHELDTSKYTWEKCLRRGIYITVRLVYLQLTRCQVVVLYSQLNLEGMVCACTLDYLDTVLSGLSDFVVIDLEALCLRHLYPRYTRYNYTKAVPLGF